MPIILVLQRCPSALTHLITHNPTTPQPPNQPRRLDHWLSLTSHEHANQHQPTCPTWTRAGLLPNTVHPRRILHLQLQTKRLNPTNFGALNIARLKFGFIALIKINFLKRTRHLHNQQVFGSTLIRETNNFSNN